MMEMPGLKPKDKVNIERWMDSLPFVRWDRFISHPSGKTGATMYVFYGWIKREKDAYKDFVLLQYRDLDEWVNYMTSSAEYSEEIGKILCGEDFEHNPCLRVENYFTVENSIKI